MSHSGRYNKSTSDRSKFDNNESFLDNYETNVLFSDVSNNETNNDQFLEMGSVNSQGSSQYQSPTSEHRMYNSTLRSEINGDEIKVLKERLNGICDSTLNKIKNSIETYRNQFIGIFEELDELLQQGMTEESKINEMQLDFVDRFKKLTGIIKAFRCVVVILDFD